MPSNFIKNMKKILFIFSLFIVFISNGQTNNIKIIYDIKLIEENFKNTDNPIFFRLNFNAENTQLIFEKYNNISTSYLANDSEIDPTLYTLINLFYPQYHNYNNKTTYSYQSQNYLLKNVDCLLDISDKYIWDFSDETKEIGGYLCYKAVLKSIENSKGSFYPVTVWYCPAIPLEAGFKNYNNLPGAVLELHEQYIAYLAKSITFNEVEKFEIPTLPIISVEEYLQKVEQAKKDNPEMFPDFKSNN